MKIALDHNSIVILRQIGVRSDILGSSIIVLQCMFNGDYGMLDLLDDTNTNKQMLTLYKELERIGLLEQSRHEDDVHFRLSNIALDILAAIGEKSPDEIKLEDWIAEYQSIWVNPDTGTYYSTPQRRSLGASAKDLTNRMGKFLSEYRDLFEKLPENKTAKEIIIEATEKYVSEYKKVAFAYCKDAYNFIMKREDTGPSSNRSTLASWCENVIMSYNHKPKITKERNKSVN